MQDVPIIDIGELSPDTLQQIDAACRDWGFFQITGHGIDPGVTSAALAQMREFFAAPLAFKKAVERTAENVWGFYDRELTKNTLDCKEIFDVGPPQDTGPLAGSVPQWPSDAAFKNAIEAFATACERVAYKVLSAISQNLGQAPDGLAQSFGDAHTSFLRLNYYPVPTEHGAPGTVGSPQLDINSPQLDINSPQLDINSPQLDINSPQLDINSPQLGINHHTDAGAITVLFQDDQPGLQVFKNDGWHTVVPRKDALVINIGDIVQVWSNDRYKAPLHRVLASDGVERFSAPYFFNPSYETNYAPLFEPAKYRPINWGDFRAGRASGDYADYGEEIQIEHFRRG